VQIPDLSVPLTSNPSVEEIQRALGLVERNHVAGLVDAHEGEVSAALDLTVLLATADLERLKLSIIEALLSRPDKLLGPCLVAEPVADEIGIASVDENGDLLEELRYQQVEWLGPIAIEQERTVYIGIAAIVRLNLGTHSLHDRRLVEVFRDPLGLGIAQVRLVLALLTNIVNVVPRLLEGAKHGVVTVDGARNTVPGALRVVAALNERLASGEGIVHGLARALVQNRSVFAAVIATSHGTIVSILRLWVRQAVSDGNTLEVDVAVLVRQDLGCENGDVVAGIRLTRDVEGLLGVLWEVVEEESQKGVDILARSDGVGDRSSAVRVSGVDGLVNEDDGGIAVPRVVVELELALRIDAGGSQFHE
jgi:hypothetical protein